MYISDRYGIGSGLRHDIGQRIHIVRPIILAETAHYPQSIKLSRANGGRRHADRECAYFTGLNAKDALACATELIRNGNIIHAWFGDCD